MALFNNSGSGFTNLQRYLGANQNNRLGQAVSSGINQAGQQVKSDLNQAGQQFQSQVGQEQSRVSGLRSDVNNVLGGDVSKATDQDVNKFQEAESGASNGPTGLANADKLGAQAQSAQQLGQAADSTSGRFGLLQRFAGGGKAYNAGQQRLDNLILGQTGGQQLQQARRSTAGLQNQFQNQQQAAGEVGKELQGNARQLQSDTVTGVGNAVTGYDAAQQAKVAQANTDRANMLTGVNTDLQGGLVNQATLDQLKAAGVDTGTTLYDTDLSKFVQASDLQANAQNIQTQDDFNKIAALTKLAGQSLTGAPSATLAQYQDASQVGAFAGDNAFTFAPAIKDAIAARAAAYQGELSPEQQAAAGFSGQRNNDLRAASDYFTQNRYDTNQPGNLPSQLSQDPRFADIYSAIASQQAGTPKVNLDQLVDQNKLISSYGQATGLAAGTPTTYNTSPANRMAPSQLAALIPSLNLGFSFDPATNTDAGQQAAVNSALLAKYPYLQGVGSLPMGQYSPDDARVKSQQTLTDYATQQALLEQNAAQQAATGQKFNINRILGLKGTS